MPNIVTEFGAADVLSCYVGLTSPPAALYVALLNELPDETINGTTLSQVEVPSGVGYARALIGVGASNWAVYGEAVANRNELLYGPSTDDWGVVRAWALCTALTDGDVIISNTLPEAWRVLGGRSYAIGEGVIAWQATSPVEPIVA